VTGTVDVYDSPFQIKDHQTVGSLIEQAAVFLFTHGDAKF
jgi:hypothetical protein